jgi:hypothetical protein
LQTHLHDAEGPVVKNDGPYFFQFEIGGKKRGALGKAKRKATREAQGL